MGSVTRSLCETTLDDFIESYQQVKSFSVGYSHNAVRAPFGRFLLLRQGDELLAIKITRHKRHSKRDYIDGAFYEWIWMHDDQRDEGEGWLSQEQNNTWIKAHSFSVNWSTGDWFYFSQPDLEMARTEAVEKEEIRSEVDRARWYSKEWVAANWEGTKASLHALFQRPATAEGR